MGMKTSCFETDLDTPLCLLALAFEEENASPSVQKIRRDARFDIEFCVVVSLRQTSHLFQCTATNIIHLKAI